MVKPTRQDMELESGLADDFDGVISHAYFGIKERYDAIAGTSEPKLVFALDGEELEQPQEVAYNTGAAKQWEVVRDGAEIVSGKNPDAHAFNMNSRAGGVVARMFNLVGAGDRAKGQDFFVARGHYMTQAAFYDGLKFHWKREEMTTVGGDKKQVLMPVSYLGEVAAKGKKDGVIPTEAIDKIVALADGKTEKELKQAIVKDPVLSKVAGLVNQVLNKGLLKTLETENKLTKSADDATGVYV